MTLSDLGTFMSGFFDVIWDFLGVPLIFGYSAKQFIIFGVIAALSVGSVRLIFGIGDGAGRLVAKSQRSHVKSRGG